MSETGKKDETESTPPKKQGWRKPLALLLAFVAVLLLAYFSRPYIKLLGPPERCWETQEIDGRLYRVNPCNGQFRLIGEVEKGVK